MYTKIVTCTFMLEKSCYIFNIANLYIILPPQHKIVYLRILQIWLKDNLILLVKLKRIYLKLLKLKGLIWKFFQTKRT